jgi:protein arginine N-methyltransferase 7
MMAWRSMCEEGRSTADVGSITACESFLPMFKLARKLLRANQVGAGVRLVHKRSDEMEVGIDMHSRADVLVSC